ncbi:DUF3168 domain-containing protein [Thioclava sp. GXIMD2076]|uniref:DUF3168 domain-containing protein n=1 Tax=Thioclava sp. GXIMD2076 TaxID=3131931 RepID=UPI0030D3F5FD
MSAAVALQDAIYAALVADPGLSAQVAGRVYDNAPSSVEYPHITFGPSQEISDDVECIAGELHAIQIDVWTQESSSKRGNKLLCKLVKAALHEAELMLDEPYAMSSLRVADVKYMGDPRTDVAHGVISIEARTEG